MKKKRLTDRTRKLLQERVVLEWLVLNIASKIYRRRGEVDDELAKTCPDLVLQAIKSQEINIVDTLERFLEEELDWNKTKVPGCTVTILDNFYLKNTQHVSAFQKRFEANVQFNYPDKKKGK